MSLEETRRRVEIAYKRQVATCARMEKAVVDLNAALVNQSHAVNEWRTNLGKLQPAMDGLSKNWVRFGNSMDRIDIKSVGDKSRELVRIMDHYEATSGRKLAS